MILTTLAQQKQREQSLLPVLISTTVKTKALPLRNSNLPSLKV